MICALAFVPIPDIQRSFNALCQICGNGEVPIIDYFAANYVSELRNGIRRPPTFEHELWSVYDRVVNNLPRTTNAVVGWHKAFARSDGQSHADIWTFIDMLKKEHVHVHLTITQHPRRRYAEINNGINIIVANYRNLQTIDYLKELFLIIFCRYFLLYNNSSMIFDNIFDNLQLFHCRVGKIGGKLSQ